MTQLLTIQKPSQNTTIPTLKWNEENKVNIWIINFFKKALFLEISIYKWIFFFLAVNYADNFYNLYITNFLWLKEK